MAIQAQLYTDNIGFPLGGSQDLMENVFGFNQFYFSSQQQQQQQQQQQPLQQNFQQQSLLHILPQKNDQNLMNIVPKQSVNVAESMTFSQCIEKQRIEIDQFISLQNERMRLILQEQRKQQLALIWRKYEPKVQFLLKQKDEEIAKAVQRTKELEEFLEKMEIENQAWQQKAIENEEIVISLNNTIEQLRESGNCLLSTNEDAESCCNVHDHDHDDDERGGGYGAQETRKMMCKSCSSRKTCIIFLPCRHLCSCKACDSFLHQCPVCGIEKKASIEALI